MDGKLPPPLSAYCTLMVCLIVALDKIPEVHLMGIVEMLLRALTKLVLRAAGK